MNLPIPFRQQKTDYHCGPASLQMIFAYFSLFKNQEEIARLANTAPLKGTSHQGMIDAATQAGFYCYVNNESSFDEVKHFLGKGLPTIVNYIEPDDEVGHYAVVAGIKESKILLHDPWNGENFSLDQDEFEQRWYDSSRTHHKWVMVLAKEDLHLGKQYHPVHAK